jgi:dipeptidyl-peptidase 4
LPPSRRGDNLLFMSILSRLLLCGSLFTLSFGLQGAEPKPKDASLDTTYLRHHAETRGFMLGRPVKPKPTPDGKSVLFLRAQARVPRLRLYEFEVASGKTRELLTPELVLKGAEENLTPEEKARRERQRVSVGGFTDFQLSHDGNQVLVSLSGKLYLFGRGDGAVRELAIGPGTILDPKFGPDGKYVSYVRDHDLYVFDLAGSKEIQTTSGGSARKTHGLAEFIAQEEMNRHTGYWWSPDSHFLVYEEADNEGVEIWHVADPIHPEQDPLPSFYPRPGKANARVRLGVVPATGGHTVWVEWDARKYPYLADVHWGSKGPLTVLVQNREQQEQLLLRVDPLTGKTTSLLTERDPAWLNLHHDGPRWLGEEAFLWSAQRNEGLQLELRAKTGELRKVLVPSEAGYIELTDVDARAGQVVYRASVDPTQAHLFRVSLDGGKPTPLSREAGVHTAAFARKHGIYVHSASTRTAMPRTTVHRSDGSLIGELPSVADNPPFVPNDELATIGAGKGFQAVVIRPRDFDRRKRYPVIVHVYGGPGHQQVLATMSMRLLPQWLADQGFIVVSIDNRGTPGRGRDWERAIRKHFGSVPLEDQTAGLKALGQRFPEMDLERAGIFGWSFGGYMSALAVLRQPAVFKAGIAGAPVVDWLDYDTHYTERYLGLPDTDAEAYKEGSLLTYAAELKRPLLLVHGTADDNVYFRHSLKLADVLFREGKDFDILPLSGLTHMVPDPVVTQRLYGRFVQFFHKHLGRPLEKP